MIQRIQTVYLGVSLILSFLFYYFTFYTAGVNGALVVSASSHLYLLPTAALVTLMHIPVIFLFNKRKTQAKLAWVLMLMLLLYTALGVAAAAQEDQNGIQATGFRLGAALPLVCVALVFLARLNILKDEALVRSMDRLR
jgi:hypothetical protein